MEGQDHITINNSGNTMSHCYDCAICKLLSDHMLKDCISGVVNWCCCFIQHQNPTPLQQCPTQTEKLPLSDTPVFTIFSHCNKSHAHKRRNSDDTSFLPWVKPKWIWERLESVMSFWVKFHILVTRQKGLQILQKDFFFKKMGPCHHIYITGFSMLPTCSKIPKFFYFAL